MAFTCAAGKHRRPSRMKRTTARAAGVAALATTGVIGTLAAPALAAEPAVEQTGLIPSSPSVTPRRPDRRPGRRPEAGRRGGRGEGRRPRRPPARRPSARAKEGARGQGARRPRGRAQAPQPLRLPGLRLLRLHRLQDRRRPLVLRQPHRHRLPRRQRHLRPRGRLRHGRRGRLGRAVRQQRRDQDERRHVHPVRPPVVPRRLRRPVGHPGPADRPVRRDRQRHRAAPALRGPHRRRLRLGHRPRRLPALARRESSDDVSAALIPKPRLPEPGFRVSAGAVPKNIHGFRSAIGNSR